MANNTAQHTNSLRFFITSLLLLAFYLSSGQGLRLQKEKIFFTTKKGKLLLITKGKIFLDNRLLYKYPDDVIIYTSKYNSVVDDSTTLLLFITLSGSPNKPRMESFRITDSKATKIVDAIASKISDLDNDGFLEFGG